MPFSAPLPIPTVSEVGVASPRAQGHAMISVVTSTMMLKTMRGSGPTLYQAIKASRPRIITVGTKYAATWSTTRWMGAFEPCASCTMRMMLESAVSLPTCVASNVKEPVLLSVAPITSSPSPFSTGMDSPVIMDSSRLLDPLTTTPSTGTLSPGRTTT